MKIYPVEMQRMRDKLRIVNDNLPNQDLEAHRDAIWLLSEVCETVLDMLERLDGEEIE